MIAFVSLNSLITEKMGLDKIKKGLDAKIAKIAKIFDTESLLKQNHVNKTQ